MDETLVPVADDGVAVVDLDETVGVGYDDVAFGELDTSDLDSLWHLVEHSEAYGACG